MSEVKPEDVPDEVEDAFRSVWRNGAEFNEAMAAALNAWPNRVMDKPGQRNTYITPALILPLVKP